MIIIITIIIIGRNSFTIYGGVVEFGDVEVIHSMIAAIINYYSSLDLNINDFFVNNNNNKYNNNYFIISLPILLLLLLLLVITMIAYHNNYNDCSLQ